MDKAEEKQQWTELWRVIGELREEFENRLIFIGGIAVYLHVKAEAPPANFIEFSHDGDFLISLADFAQLREEEEVIRNRRFAKYQIIRRGFNLDIYLERQNNLRVPFSDAFAHSTVIGGIRVASPEHLLVLKLDAYKERFRSRKGEKDSRDLIRISYILQRKGINAKLLWNYLTDENFLLLKSVEKTQQFMTLANHNPHTAKKLRDNFVETISSLARSKSSRDRSRIRK